MKEEKIEIRTIELGNGLGDYYNELMASYIENELPNVEDEEKFISDIERLISEPISFSDKLSILNGMLTAIKRKDVWHLIRLG
jgi:hypothetical protein